ncbi:hypothetical protein Pan44_01030 [Caulifigura coniformis]|uniref:Zinc-finger domain-containing protein n=1 Tax=Caulifigura coniformis TaxID=2527983 RepID=A0A517S7I8_9PLAN|nr:hypothetical protein [Caulifigura coniformis]QDT52094.1 hypothetical protein Pan44_01030 [Caulifigura coniformis]
MTCDDAFDQLTAPGRAGDPALAAHLAGCSRCRAMAETLAPAIALFREPAGDTAPVAAATATAVARRSAARLSRRASRTSIAHSPVRRGLALLGAALAGAACCLAAIQLSGRGDHADGEIARCPRKSPEASKWMERHSLPVAMACIACHPSGGMGMSPPLLRPASALGGSL